MEVSSPFLYVVFVIVDENRLRFAQTHYYSIKEKHCKTGTKDNIAKKERASYTDKERSSASPFVAAKTGTKSVINRSSIVKRRNKPMQKKGNDAFILKDSNLM